MNETKNQLRIITALLVVVIALAGGLFFFMPAATQVSATPNDPTEPSDQPPAHIKIREAEISLDPALVYTQTFGGSGDETAEEIFYNDGLIYIFGNTTSADFDFDRAGAYLAIMDELGATRAFVSYPGTLVAVTLYEGGFVLALDGDASPVALAVNYDGMEVKTTAIPTTRSEKALDIKYVDGGYLFITALVWEMGGFSRLKMTMLSHDLEYIGAIVTDEVYSLEYVDTLDIAGNYTLIANAVSSLKNMLCVGSWGKIMAYYPQEFSYTVHGFWVIDGEFFYLVTTDTSTVLLKEDGTVINICGKTTDPHIVGDKDHMYISADDDLYCVSAEKIESSTVAGRTSFYVDDHVYAVSENGRSMTVRSFKGGVKAYTTSFVYEMTSAKVFTCEKGMFVFGVTKGKFGGKDVTLIKVNY